MKKLFTKRSLISTTSKKLGILLPLFLAFMETIPSFAWGPVGHETAAYIAQDNLSPVAKEKIRRLMEPESDIRLMNHDYLDLPSISNWADHIRQFGRPETAPWH